MAVGVGVVLLFFLGFIALFVVLAVVLTKAARREGNQRWERLWSAATAYGWRRPAAGERLPPAVLEAAGTSRTKLVLVTRYQGFDLWLVWHQWTESRSSGDSTTTTTENLTRYYLWPLSPHPDMKVTRRTRLGAALMPVRGPGTGDVEFDRQFMVHGPPRAFLPDRLRYAMLTGEVPAWEIAGGTLVLAYGTQPTPENLQPGADLTVRLAHLMG